MTVVPITNPRPSSAHPSRVIPLRAPYPVLPVPVDDVRERLATVPALLSHPTERVGVAPVPASGPISPPTDTPEARDGHGVFRSSTPLVGFNRVQFAADRPQERTLTVEQDPHMPGWKLSPQGCAPCGGSWTWGVGTTIATCSKEAVWRLVKMSPQATHRCDPEGGMGTHFQCAW